MPTVVSARTYSRCLIRYWSDLPADEGPKEGRLRRPWSWGKRAGHGRQVAGLGLDGPSLVHPS